MAEISLKMRGVVGDLRGSRRMIAFLITLGGLFFLALILSRQLPELSHFPEEWNLGLSAPLDEFKWWVVANRKTHWMFQWIFEPLSDGIDFFIRRAEDLLLWLPWPAAVAGVFLLGNKLGRLRLALVTSASLFLMGLLSLWNESMQTLALMVTAVIISLLIGIPLGIWAAHSDRIERILRPILDAMQTMPAFVYLIPVVLFFGIARVPSVIATIIYAVPPAIRLTNLGIRQVSAASIEAARAFGSTPRQILYKVKIPEAMPSIMMGVNQTIMMALAIVVIAALIGGGGLGDVVLKSLRRLQVGTALEGGLAIVFMAVLLDRLSYAVSQIEYSSQQRYQGFLLLPEQWSGKRWVVIAERLLALPYRAGARLQEWVTGRLSRLLPSFQEGIQKNSYLVTSLAFLLLLLVVCIAVGWMEFPSSWDLSLSKPVDQIVYWMQVNLFQVGDTFIGTGPLSDFITIYLLRPMRFFLMEWMAWPMVMLLVVAAALAVSGVRLAFFSLACMLLMGALGMWDFAMDTLTQVLLAVLLSLFMGIPLGIWAGRSDTVEQVLRPILDFLQTIPPFVYLVPVIMLFHVGRVPGIMASVLYALPPAIRLTSLGIRQVAPAALEAAEAFGSTAFQTLRKVQLPLALPSIMLGINQTIIMVLAMVIIAGLVGAAGLGFEVVEAMANNKIGASAEAGLAIVLMAIVLDRITQAWAERRKQAANI